MSPEVVTGLGFAAVIVLLVVRTPIGAALGIVGLAGIAAMLSPEAALIKTGVIAFEVVTKYDLGVLPLFMFMAHVLFAAGASAHFFETASRFVGHRRGGLAIASVAGCAGFGAISGSSLATTATMGLVALPEMRKAGYDPGLATGALAAGGTLGVLIPPSGALIVYGVISEQSIGKLFMAGVIPGLTQAMIYGVLIWMLCLFKPSLGPAQPRSSWGRRIQSMARILDILLLVVVVLAGILIGWFTPTEAAAVGALGSLLVAALRGKLTPSMLRAAIIETLQTSGMIYLVIIGALVFSAFISATGFAATVAHWVGAASLGAYGAIALMALILLALGMFLDGMGIMLLTTPIFLPIAEANGFSAIWFGIFLVRAIEIGFLTPPVGMNVYVMHGIAKDIPLATIFRGVVPFFLVDLLHLALLVALPALALWLPGLMGA